MEVAIAPLDRIERSPGDAIGGGSTGAHVVRRSSTGRRHAGISPCRRALGSAAGIVTTYSFPSVSERAVAGGYLTHVLEEDRTDRLDLSGSGSPVLGGR